MTEQMRSKLDAAIHASRKYRVTSDGEWMRIGKGIWVRVGGSLEDGCIFVFDADFPDLPLRVFSDVDAVDVIE